MTANKNLIDKLTVLKNILGDRLYAEVAPRFLAEWQREHNSLLLAEVLEGRTTFEAALLPLVRVNLDIDFVEGSDDSFDSAAGAAKDGFKDIMSLEGHVVVDGQPHQGNLAEPLWGIREARRHNLRTVGVINGLGTLIFCALIYLIASPGYEWPIIGIVCALVAVVSVWELWSFNGVTRFHHHARPHVIKAVQKKVLELDRLVRPPSRPDSSVAAVAA